MLFTAMPIYKARRADRYYYIFGNRNPEIFRAAGVDTTIPVVGPITKAPIPQDDINKVANDFAKLLTRFNLNPDKVNLVIKRKQRASLLSRRLRYSPNGKTYPPYLEAGSFSRKADETKSWYTQFCEDVLGIHFKKFKLGVSLNAAMLEICSPREIAPINAHELSHMKHRDWLRVFPAIAASIPISILVNNALDLFLEGKMIDDQVKEAFKAVYLNIIVVGATLFTLGPLMRHQEFRADREAAINTQDPVAMISALRKLDLINKLKDETGLFSYLSRRIRKPKKEVVKAKKKNDAFSPTHPSVENRIRALEIYAESIGQSLDDQPQQTEYNTKAMRNIYEELKPKLYRLRPETREQLLKYAGVAPA